MCGNKGTPAFGPRPGEHQAGQAAPACAFRILPFLDFRSAHGTSSNAPGGYRERVEVMREQAHCDFWILRFRVVCEPTCGMMLTSCRLASIAVGVA